MKKTVPILLSLILLLSSLLFVFGTSADGTDRYVLYKNDTKFSFSQYPPMLIGDELYVPSSFFLGFKNILYEYSEKYESFYFMNTETGRYFAFSFGSDGIILDGNHTSETFPVINSTIYMPLEYCADILSLKIETYEEEGVIHKRLTDLTHSLDFIELIELFDPAGRLNPVSPDNPDIPDTPPITDPSVPSSTAQTTVYLLLDIKDANYTRDIINTLEAFGEKATLFFDAATVAQKPKEIYHALICGNAVGISASGNKTAEDAKETQNVLYLLTNGLSETCLADGNAEELENAGFTVWTAILDADKTEGRDSERANEIYAASLTHERVSVKVSATEENNNLILHLLGLFSNDKRIKLAVINPGVSGTLS